ncbi:TPA: hypothetical protein DDW35_12145 [Candidatus Sumerlaeota bacterium]|nr:hypothetical protein [Candidatus Sumerlaeota bacterium]
MNLSTESSSRSFFFWGCLLLVLLGVFVFYPVCFATFNWDDHVIINPENFQPAGSLATLWLNPRTAIAGDYWPLDYTSHWMEFQLWGMNARGYHLVNLALHLFNACLLWYLLQRIAVRGALLVAILFTLHPMQVSSVAWIVERKDLLNTLFYFLAFAAWMRFDEKPGWTRYLITAIFFVASLLCKSMSITWPVAALLYIWWRTGRVNRRRIYAAAFLLALAFPLVFIRPLLGWVTPPLGIAPLSWMEKIILVGRNWCFYASKLVWPLEHVAVYPKWDINPHHAILFCFPATMVLVLAALWILRNRIGRGPFAATAFYTLTLSPILGLISWSLLKTTYVQDHYQYIASIGPFLLGAYAFEMYAPRWFRFVKKPEIVAYAPLSIFLLIPLSVLANYHAALYHDRETLFRENYRRYPTATSVALQYASGLLNNRKTMSAYPIIDHAIALDPQLAANWQVKGNILYNLNRLSEARTVYERALVLDPQDADSIFGYTTVLLKLTPPEAERAITLLEQALQRMPANNFLHENMAKALLLNGQADKALVHFETALRADPFNADLLNQYHQAQTTCSAPQKTLRVP